METETLAALMVATVAMVAAVAAVATVATVAAVTTVAMVAMVVTGQTGLCQLEIRRFHRDRNMNIRRCGSAGSQYVSVGVARRHVLVGLIMLKQRMGWVPSVRQNNSLEVLTGERICLKIQVLIFCVIDRVCYTQTPPTWHSLQVKSNNGHYLPSQEQAVSTAAPASQVCHTFLQFPRRQNRCGRWQRHLCPSSLHQNVSR